MMVAIDYKIGTHREQKVIFFVFDYNAKIVAEIRQYVGCKWSQTQKSWYVPDVLEYRKRF